MKHSDLDTLGLGVVAVVTLLEFVFRKGMVTAQKTVEVVGDHLTGHAVVAPILLRCHFV